MQQGRKRHSFKAFPALIFSSTRCHRVAQEGQSVHRLCLNCRSSSGIFEFGYGIYDMYVNHICGLGYASACPGLSTQTSGNNKATIGNVWLTNDLLVVFLQRTVGSSADHATTTSHLMPILLGTDEEKLFGYSTTGLRSKSLTMWIKTSWKAGVKDFWHWVAQGRPQAPRSKELEVRHKFKRQSDLI